MDVTNVVYHLQKTFQKFWLECKWSTTSWMGHPFGKIVGERSGPIFLVMMFGNYGNFCSIFYKSHSSNFITVSDLGLQQLCQTCPNQNYSVLW